MRPRILQITMTPPLSPAQEKYLLLTLAGIQFSHVLDFMIMMPLGPILIAEFGISTHAFGLLVAAYSFSAAASGLLGAIFVDRFERRNLLLGTFILFGLATLACGLAPGYFSLLIARGFAGAFGGIMGALVHTMIGDAIPFERRAKAGSLVSAAFSVSTVAGVPVSLWLANLFNWRAPFIFIALLVVIFAVVGWKLLPQLRHHLSPEKEAHPFAPMFNVLRDANHWRALAFSALIIFSGFTIIPYITVYSVHNIGISQHDIPLIYLAGGSTTLITARLIGHWADARGKVEIYRWVALAALLPLYVVTHLTSAPLWLWIICTTVFFILVSGRMIPAMAIITSSAQPKLRGTFMTLNATTQALAMGLATTLAGFIISQNEAGLIVDYSVVGYVAIVANLIAIWFVGRIAMHQRH